MNNAPLRFKSYNNIISSQFQQYFGRFKMSDCKKHPKSGFACSMNTRRNQKRHLKIFRELAEAGTIQNKLGIDRRMANYDLVV